MRIPGRVPHFNTLQTKGHIWKQAEEVHPDVFHQEFSVKRIPHFLGKLLLYIILFNNEEDIHANPEDYEYAYNDCKGPDQVFPGFFQCLQFT